MTKVEFHSIRLCCQSSAGLIISAIHRKDIKTEANYILDLIFDRNTQNWSYLFKSRRNYHYANQFDANLSINIDMNENNDNKKKTLGSYWELKV